MPSYCAAFGCRNSGYLEGISFHSFPLSNKPILKTWLVKMKRENYVPTKNSKLCCEHFEEDCFILQNFTGRRQLKSDAVPTKFVFSKENRRKRNSYQMRPSRTQGKVQGTVGKRRTGKSCYKDPLTEILNHSSANSNSKHTEKSEFGTTKESLVFPPEVVLKVEQSDQEEEIVEDICDEGKEIAESGQESQEQKNDTVSTTMKRLFAPVIFTPNKISKREEVFGHFVACEMSYLCENPALYLKVQQNILKTLVEAQFELISSEL